MASIEVSEVNGNVVLISKNDEDVFEIKLLNYKNDEEIGKIFVEDETALIGRITNEWMSAKMVVFFNVCDISNSIEDALKDRKMAYCKIDEDFVIVMGAVLLRKFDLKVGEAGVKIIVQKHGINLYEYHQGSKQMFVHRHNKCIYLNPEIEKDQNLIKGLLDVTGVGQFQIHFADVSNEMKQKYCKLLKSKRTVFVDGKFDYMVYLNQAVVERSKWDFNEGKKALKLMTSKKNYKVFIKINGEDHEILSINAGELLPTKKTVAVSGIYKDCIYMLENGKLFKHELLHDSDFGFELTLSVEKGDTREISFDADPERKLAEYGCHYASEIFTVSYPVIVFLHNMSFILLPRNGKLELWDKWNGGFGRLNILSLGKASPRFFEKALKDLQDYPESVVYDVIKLMASTFDDIEVDKCWPFNVVPSDEERDPMRIEIVYEMEYHEQSPAFFMAMLLDKHKKAIEMELNIKLDKFGFFILHQCTAEERHQLHEKFEESCNLREMKCAFVEFFLPPKP